MSIYVSVSVSIDLQDIIATSLIIIAEELIYFYNLKVNLDLHLPIHIPIHLPIHLPIKKLFQLIDLIDFKKSIRAQHEIALTQSRNDDVQYFGLVCLYYIMF